MENPFPSNAKANAAMQETKVSFNAKTNSNAEYIKRSGKVEHERVDNIANWLVETFSSPTSRDFYCKVAWKLPQVTIERLVVESFEVGKNPGGLFNFLARKEIDK